MSTDKQLLEVLQQAIAELQLEWKGLKEEEKASCPPATQDLKLNTKNRDAAIKAEHIQYGPLNGDKPGDYWSKIGKYWNTTEEAAKASKCGNCVAFDISPRMDECMPGQTSDKDGRLGYCWMHNFKCHSARSCRTWAKGGPIEEDKVSLDWQERQEDSVEESLWDNINAKKKAGKKSSHKNSNAYKDAKKAGNALKQEDVNFDSLEKKLDDLFDQLDIDINFTTHFKERVIQRNVKEEDILDLAQKIIAKYEDELVYMDKGDNAVMTHLSKLLDVAVVSGGYGEDYLKDLIFKTAYKRDNKSEPEFRTNKTSPKLKVAEISKDGKITCDKCGWSWNKADGGDDLYICHKCNNNNAPKALENFKDGKVKGKSRPGRVKKAGASCKGSKSSLRAKAKKYGGEKGKMYHWCANMKKEDVTQAIKEVLAEKATCCGRCGRVHVKGNCKRPYLKGKKHCRNNK